MFPCIQEECDSVVGIVTIDEEEAIFSGFDLVSCLLIEYLDPLDANFTVGPSLLLVSDTVTSN